MQPLSISPIFGHLDDICGVASVCSDIVIGTLLAFPHLHPECVKGSFTVPAL